LTRRENPQFGLIFALPVHMIDTCTVSFVVAPVVRFARSGDLSLQF
jgi:hypothetical protein